MENLAWETLDDNAVITGRRDNSPLLVIPPEIDNRKIIGIKAEAFAEDNNLESVCLQAGLIEIGQNAFAFCENLKTINLPPSIKTLGDAVFEGCVSLENLSLPPELTRIQKSLFEECSSLTFMEIPPKVTIIGQRAFEFCLNLRQVVFLGNAVESIENGAFFLCRRLETFSMPDSVTRTGKEILLGARKLHRVHLSQNLKRIETGLLARCKSLTTITIPQSVETICNGAFAECCGLKTFELKNFDVSMGVKVFDDCTHLLENAEFVERMKKFLNSTTSIR